jgi:hypothetical protein
MPHTRVAYATSGDADGQAADAPEPSTERHNTGVNQLCNEQDRIPMRKSVAVVSVHARLPAAQDLRDGLQSVSRTGDPLAYNAGRSGVTEVGADCLSPAAA